MYKVYRVYAETNDATTKYYLFGASNPAEANELIADFNKRNTDWWFAHFVDTTDEIEDVYTDKLGFITYF